MNLIRWEICCLAVGLLTQFIFLGRSILPGQSGRAFMIWKTAAVLGAGIVLVYGLSRSDPLLIIGQLLVAAIIIFRPKPR